MIRNARIAIKGLMICGAILLAVVSVRNYSTHMHKEIRLSSRLVLGLHCYEGSVGLDMLFGDDGSTVRQELFLPLRHETPMVRITVSFRDPGNGFRPIKYGYVLREGMFQPHDIGYRDWPTMTSVRVAVRHVFIRTRWWLVCAILAVYPGVELIYGSFRRWRRRRKALCIKCGYDLTGNESGTCPECGTGAALR